MRNNENGEARRTRAPLPQSRSSSAADLSSHAPMALAPALGLLLFGAGAVALYAALFAPLMYPYAGDSVAYIESARSLLAGEPFLYSMPFGQEGDRQILRLWPPGYPTLMAIVSAFTGLDAALAGLWLTRLSVAVLPVLVYWAIYRAAGVPIAVLAGLLTISTAGLLPYAHRVATDPFFEVLVVLSMGVLLRGLAARERRSAWLLALAGLIAGGSICIRNTGIALVFAGGVTIAAQWLAKEGSVLRVVRQGLVFAVPAALAVIPLMLWNLYAFGILRPYEMEPSTIGVAENIEQMVFAFIFDLLPILRGDGGLAGILRARTAVVAPLMVAGVLVIVVMGLITLRREHTPAGRLSAEEQHRADRLRGAFLIFAACYSLTTVVITVAARSRYEWGGFIGYRHVAQFDWLVVAAGLCAIAPCLAKWRATLLAVVGIAVCVVGLRAWYLLGFHDWAASGSTDRTGLMLPPIVFGNGTSVSRETMLAFSRSPAAAKLIAGIPGHCDIVGNIATVVQVDYKRQARQVYERGFTMADFASLPKPSVLIFVAMPGFDIRGIEPPGPGYRTIRDPVFVAFEDPVCGSGGPTP